MGCMKNVHIIRIVTLFLESDKKISHVIEFSIPQDTQAILKKTKQNKIKNKKHFARWQADHV